MNLSDIFCQNKAKTTLNNAFKCGRVGHAYIFAGQKGVGKYTTAKAWAKLLMCSQAKNENEQYDACGKCKSCTAFKTGTHPDFNNVHKELIQFTKKTENRKKIPLDMPIDVIREFVINKAT